ncbi:HAD superfamily protein involved in N-acetyl-glucosamine catabolism [Labilithrix luteola]|uniref:HAD superfamily protein involved in N-acetyl-glucosamine catabolism n=1 Tax=Labilithrix luteola TaxID=1391654 RepID=A0A0K1Q8W5_9BACT|nr:HAD superfamily protein involved in N-acetyl-glucosamine catabolism [Labilithrix luteola]
MDTVLSLRADYDAFLIDVWGVLHRGESLFEGVAEVIDELASTGARVVFLSNSSRLGTTMAESLVQLGIRRDAFDGVVSSGDVTREALERRAPELFAALGPSPRAFHLGNPAFVPWLFELGLDFTEDEREAELLVATGTVKDLDELAHARERLRPLAARNVPLVCTNPDRVVPMGEKLAIGPGAVAAEYASLGGRTFLYGKPHAPIYREALARVGVSPARVVAIGDTMETDIAGARAASIASVLVTSGVHGMELGDAPEDSAIDALVARHGAAPDAVIVRFGQRSTDG